MFLKSGAIRNNALVRLKYGLRADGNRCQIEQFKTGELLSKPAQFPNRFIGNKYLWMYVSQGYDPVLHTCREKKY